MKKSLIAVMGVSASGKNTQISNIQSKYSKIFTQVLSHKTRDLRPGEIDGIDYHKTTIKDFLRGIELGLYIERNKYGDKFGLTHYYGTQTSSIKQHLQQKNVIKEMEPFGFARLLQNYTDKIGGIFIDVPDETIIERATLRGGMTEHEIKYRVKQAQEDRNTIKQFTKQNSVYIIDGNGSIENVFHNIETSILQLID